MRQFLNQLQDQKIVEAIRAAEKKSSGEIRVFVSRRKVDDAVAAAKSTFERLKMHQTRDRNGVLIWVAPQVRKFAVVGDTAVHERCGEGFWQEIADAMTSHFKENRGTEAIVHAVERAGALLAEHFPRRADDRNELPDRVERD